MNAVYLDRNLFSRRKQNEITVSLFLGGFCLFLNTSANVPIHIFIEITVSIDSVFHSTKFIDHTTNEYL